MKRLVPIISLLAGCAPGPDIDPASQQTYLVYDWNAELGSYELHPSTIRTLEDPRLISGSIAELRGGGALVIQNSTPASKEEFADAIAIRRDKPPSAEFYVDDGVVVPYDFDTQMMVTLYHHLERAHDYFVALEVEPVGRLPVHYFPEFSLFGLPLQLFTDNAAYAMTLDAFLIPPTVRLDEGVPLSANRGVIVHEYSHAVFNRIVFDDDRAPDPLWNPAFPADVVALLRSLDEGLADTFAALALGDSNFISPSISAEQFEIDRDLAAERIWDGELQQEIETFDVAPGNPYLLGSVIASSLWATRDFLTDDTVAMATVAAMEAIALPDASFSLATFFNAWLAQLTPAEAVAACDIFTVRLELIRDELACD